MNKPLNIIFLGLSGSGKGTQVGLLKQKLLTRQKVYESSTGEMFRKLKETDSDAGKGVALILKQGGLCPKSVALSLWINKMLWDLKEDEGVMMEGSPRSLWEAQGTDEFFQFMQRSEHLHVVHLRVSSEEITRRLLARAREDDTEEAIKARIAYFTNDVVPVIEHYQEQGCLIEINGEQSAEKVHEDIVKALGF